MINLQGKVAIVTGGAAGIGEATVRTMARLGAKVVIADVDEARSELLADELKSAGAEVLACRTDILVERDIAGMVETAVSHFGGLDILHNNAGVPRTVAPDCEVADLPVEWWHKTLDAHLTSAMLGCKYALPRMIARGGGAIVNTSSSSANDATVDLPSYGAAKAGLHQLTREVAATYGRNNIRCNAVVPVWCLRRGAGRPCRRTCWPCSRPKHHCRAWQQPRTSRTSPSFWRPMQPG